MPPFQIFAYAYIQQILLNTTPTVFSETLLGLLPMVRSCEERLDFLICPFLLELCPIG